MLKAKEIRIRLINGTMDCIRFGSGKDVLVMIPGVGDGLKTVRGTAKAFALLYRKLAKRYTVYVFSRRNDLPWDWTTRDMAADLAEAMELLKLPASFVIGVSQGGMIAQWLAIDHPEKVRKLLLTVTYSRPNPTVREVIGGWMRMAEAGNYQAIMTDTAEKSYSEKYLRIARPMYALLGNVGKPSSFERFMIQARSCLNHDTYERLGEIRCPVLVLGGDEDRIVTGEGSREMASRIPDSRLFMYEGLGHGLYEEAKDFQDRIIAFCV